MWLRSFYGKVIDYAEEIMQHYISLHLPRYLENFLTPEIRDFVATFGEQTGPFRIPAKIESFIKSYRERPDQDMNDDHHFDTQRYCFDSEFYSLKKMIPFTTEIIKANLPYLGMEYYEMLEYLDYKDRAALACVCKNFTLPPNKQIVDFGCAGGGMEKTDEMLPANETDVGLLGEPDFSSWCICC